MNDLNPPLVKIDIETAKLCKEILEEMAFNIGKQERDRAKYLLEKAKEIEIALFVK